jgi:hypothetical protein
VFFPSFSTFMLWINAIEVVPRISTIQLVMLVSSTMSETLAFNWQPHLLHPPSMIGFCLHPSAVTILAMIPPDSEGDLAGRKYRKTWAKHILYLFIL